MKSFKEAIRNADFTLTAELSLTPDVDAAAISAQCSILAPAVDAIALTENQYGHVHLSPLAAASILLRENIDPVLQLSCRNRNRIALMSDLLGARALGVTSLLLVRGDKVPNEITPRPKSIADMRASELIATAKTMNEDERLEAAGDFLIGASATVHRPTPGFRGDRLLHKVDAGARFAQTQLCMDPDMLRSYMSHLVAAKLTRRIDVIATVAVLPSAETAQWLASNRAKVVIPDTIIERLRQSSDAEAEGVKICAEQLQLLTEVPGVGGANVISAGHLELIPAAIGAAGLGGER